MIAIGERVAGEARQACAGGRVVNRHALGVSGARTGTGIPTPGPDATLVGRAVRVNDALGSAAFVGIADVVREASARAGPVGLFAPGVGTAGRGVAGRRGFR